MKSRFCLGIVAAIVMPAVWPDTPLVTTLEGSIGSNSHYVFAFGAPDASDDQVHQGARARARQLCNGAFVVVENRSHPGGNRGGKDFLIVRCGAELPTNLRYAPLAEYVATYDLANDRYTIKVPIDAVAEIATGSGLKAGSTTDTGKSIPSSMPPANEVHGVTARSRKHRVKHASPQRSEGYRSRQHRYTDARKLRSL